MKNTKFLTTLCALVLGWPAGAVADELRPGTEQAGRRFSGGMEVTRGDYGQSGDTTILYLPLSYRTGEGPWTYGVTVPWISVDGFGNVTRDLGRYGAQGARRSESGLGDIVLSATRALAQADSALQIDATAKLKLGTASRSKGLGTGEEDLHFQVEFYGKSGEFTPFVTAGYKVLGDPPGVGLRDVAFLEVGATRQVGATRTAGLMWHGQERAVAGGKAQSELTAYYQVRLDVEWSAQLYGLVGLSDGSPDLGGGAFLIRRF